MLFGGVYTVYCIRSLVQEYSPGGDTVLLSLICYVIRRVAGWRSEMRLSWGLVGDVTGRERGFGGAGIIVVCGSVFHDPTQLNPSTK